MKLYVYVSIAVVLFISGANAASLDDEAHQMVRSSRRKRGADQVVAMLTDCTDLDDIDEYIDYSTLLNYGCYCGPNIDPTRHIGGKGNPDSMDAADECCKAHDECWEEARNDHKYCFRSWWTGGEVCIEYCQGHFYQYNFDEDSCQCADEDQSNDCMEHLCECDTMFAECIHDVEEEDNDEDGDNNAFTPSPSARIYHHPAPRQPAPR